MVSCLDVSDEPWCHKTRQTGSSSAKIHVACHHSRICPPPQIVNALYCDYYSFLNFRQIRATHQSCLPFSANNKCAKATPAIWLNMRGMLHGWKRKWKIFIWKLSCVNTKWAEDSYGADDVEFDTIRNIGLISAWMKSSQSHLLQSDFKAAITELSNSVPGKSTSSNLPEQEAFGYSVQMPENLHPLEAAQCGEIHIKEVGLYFSQFLWNVLALGLSERWRGCHNLSLTTYQKKILQHLLHSNIPSHHWCLAVFLNV